MIKHVYLIESECGRIKLGSSNSPEQRLALFSVNSPRPLRLIAIWPGSQSDELQLHKRFSQYRTHNEWFRPVGEFEDFVAAQRGIGVAAIPDWPVLAWGEVNLRGKAKLAAAQRAIRSDPVWQAHQAFMRAWRRRIKESERELGRPHRPAERSAELAAFQAQWPASLAKQTSKAA